MSDEPEIHLTEPWIMPHATIIAGDTVDFGNHGVLVWLRDEDAQAWRLQTRKRIRETRQGIEAAERRVNAAVTRTKPIICAGCPDWAWGENHPGGVYGPEKHPLSLGDLGSHEWDATTPL